MNLPIVQIPIQFENDVVLALQRIRTFAGLAGLGTQDQTRLATAASEILRNALLNAGGGQAELSIAQTAHDRFFQILIKDTGPGIQDVDDILAGNFTSKKGLGLGLRGARSLVDAFTIDTDRRGTAITLGKRLPPRAEKVTSEHIRQWIGEADSHAPQTAYDEVRKQNLQLAEALEALSRKEAELEQQVLESRRLNKELEKFTEKLEARVKARTVELSRANESLRVKDERYATATRAAGVGVWEWDAGKNEFYLDPNLNSILGYGEGEIPNDYSSWANHVHPEDRPMWMEGMLAHLEGKTPEYACEHRMLHKDGSTRWFFVHGVAIRDEQGDTTRMVGTDADITERKRAEEALRESEERFRSLAHSAKNGIIIIDDYGKTTFWNPGAEKIFGYSEGEILGMDLHRLLAPASCYAAYEAGIEAFREKGYAKVLGKTLELTALKKDGTEFSIDLSLSSVRLKGRWHAIGIVRDITERKRAEEALRESEARFKALFDSVSDVVWVSSRDGTVFRYLNPLAEEVYGKPLSELYDTNTFWLDAVHPEDKDKAVASGTELWEQGKSSAEYRIIRPDGEVRWLLDRKAKIVDEGGEIVGIGGVATDITERKQAEKVLVESEAHLKLVMDTLTAGIFIIDAVDGAILEANHTAAKMAGVRRKELIGVPCHRHFLSSTDKECPLFLEAENNGQSECVLNTADGHHVPVLQTMTEIIYKDRSCFIVTFIDISERKAMEARAGLAQKMVSLGELAAGIAHEINSPTHYIHGNVEFLQKASNTLLESVGSLRRVSRDRDAPEEERAREVDRIWEKINYDFLVREVPEAFDSCFDGIDRITKIVESMRYFAHPGSDERTSTNINKSVENALIVSRNEWKYYADVEKDLQPDLPILHTYLGQLNQALLNIIINAAHAIRSVVGDTPKEKGLVTISTRQERKWVAIRISDTGTGIPEHLRNRIFDPFFTTKPVGQGTGQGLAVAHSVVVEKHGGSIDIESEEGKGTTFILRLPIENSGRS
jgi:two-component system, NtrC family, sensor kinase